MSDTACRTLDLDTLVNDYIKLNEQRKKFEDSEVELRKKINDAMEQAGVTEYTSRKGTVRIQLANRVDYDTDFLKKVLPDDIFSLVTRISVHTRTLEDLIKDGKVDERLVQPSRKITSFRRLIVVPRKKAKLVKEDI